MCRIRIHVTAAVGSQHLDRDLRCYRALGDHLCCHDLVLHQKLSVRPFEPLAFVIFLSTETFIGSIRVALSYGLKFWIIPWDMSNTANTTQMGSSR